MGSACPTHALLQQTLTAQSFESCATYKVHIMMHLIGKHTAPNVVQLQRALLCSSATQHIEIDAALHARLIKFKATLQDALEPLAYIHESANQVQLRQNSIMMVAHTCAIHPGFS